MRERFDRYVERLEEYLTQLQSGTQLSVGKTASFPEDGGCYVLIEGVRYLYVGISKNIRQRMRNHTSGRPEQSVFAYKLACEVTGKKSDYTKTGSKKILVQDPEFSQAMIASTKRVKDMDAKFVVIPDAMQRYLFELYAAVCLETPYNDFNTH